MRIVSRLERPSALDQAVTVGQRAIRWLHPGRLRDGLHGSGSDIRRSYIDPRLIDRYLDGEHVSFPLDRLSAGVRPGWPATQGGFEAAVIRLLTD
jgi:hypothetical protein